MLDAVAGPAQPRRAVSADAALKAQRDKRRQGKAQPESDDGSWRVGLRDDVARVFGRLDSGVNPEEVSRLQALVRETLAADSRAVARRGVDAIRESVTAANAAAERSRRSRTEALTLASGLGGIEGDRADGLREELGVLARRGMAATESVKARVEELRAQSKEERERTHVLGTLKDAFGELGYSIGPEFLTQLADHGYADARRGDLGPYAVRVRAQPGTRGISLNVVRGESDRTDLELRDAEVEQEFCTDFHEVLRLMAGDGVTATIRSGQAAGALPVQVVSDLPAARAGSERRRRSAPKSRRVDE